MPNELCKNCLAKYNAEEQGCDPNPPAGGGVYKSYYHGPTDRELLKGIIVQLGQVLDNQENIIDELEAIRRDQRKQSFRSA